MGKPEGCASPAGGVIKKRSVEQESETMDTDKGVQMGVMVGKEAPDFEATAYFEGGFRNFKLSEFRGKWVFLCFYPGDFTFV